MIFQDYQSEKNEVLFHVQIKALEKYKGTSITWTYPFQCRKVCLFIVPLYEQFDESIAHKFECVTLEYPQKSYQTEKICNIAVYTINSDGNYIRQPQQMYYFPVLVKYFYHSVSEKFTVKTKLKFLKKSSVINHTILNITSNADIQGKDILYDINVIGENEKAVFCLPFNITAGKNVEIEVTEKFQYYTDKPYINIVEGESD